MSEHPLPPHLAEIDGWIEVPGLGWLREVEGHNGGIDFWWWHLCPPIVDKPQRDSLRTIDCSTGERHAVVGGSLAGGDLTIHGGTGSIPCADCGLHGHLVEGEWVPS